MRLCRDLVRPQTQCSLEDDRLYFWELDIESEREREGESEDHVHVLHATHICNASKRSEAHRLQFVFASNLAVWAAPQQALIA